MKISFETREGFLIVRAHEAVLDVGNAGEFKQALVDAIGERAVTLIVDISGVHEIDSSGLGALVAALKAARKFGGTVKLCGAEPPVRSVIEMTRIHRVLPLHATAEEAMRGEVPV